MLHTIPKCDLPLLAWGVSGWVGNTFELVAICTTIQLLVNT